MLNQDTFLEFLVSACGYEINEPVLAAISGGLDSVVLCDLLLKNKIPFAIAHVNFRLRGDESTADEIFVAELAKKINVPFYLKRCTPETFKESGENSIQVAARKIRYTFFETTCKENGFQKIVVAHHKDDSIETALLNFARGTGVAGLTGIHPKKGNIFRPLLFATREEILSYATANAIIWREDSSNESDKYNRNRFRHHLLPYLMSEIPQAYAGFDASFKRLEESEELIRGAMEMWEAKCCSASIDEIKISIDAIKEFPKSEVFLLFFLRRNGFKDLQIESLINLISGNVGTQLISKTHRIIRDRDYFFLVPKTEQGETELSSAFTFSEEPFTGEIPNDQWTAVIDSAKIEMPLQIRTWKSGDKLIPFGMKGHRNVSDILNDLKLPLHKKEKAPVILSGNEIVWVPGYRIAEKFRITPSTTSTLKLFFNSEKHGD